MCQYAPLDSRWVVETLGAVIALFLPVAAVAQSQDYKVVPQEVVVVAPYDALRARERVAANVQSATAEEIARSPSLDLTDFLNRSFGSVSINHTQGNPLQPDVNFRASDWLTLFVRIENLFDEDYETFGLLGEPGEVFEDFEDPRFFGAGPPFGAWTGFRIQL